MNFGETLKGSMGKKRPPFLPSRSRPRSRGDIADSEDSGAAASFFKVAHGVRDTDINVGERA